MWLSRLEKWKKKSSGLILTFFSWNRARVMSLLSHSNYAAVSWLWKVLQATYHRAGGQNSCLKHGHGVFLLQNLVHHSQWGMWQSRISHACFTSCLNLTTTSNANIKGLLHSEAWTTCVRQVKFLLCSVALKAGDEILVYAMNKAELRPSDWKTFAGITYEIWANSSTGNI